MISAADASSGAEQAWSVAVFTARESMDTLRASIDAAIIACAGHAATIHVLVNGNEILAEEAAAGITDWATSAPAEVGVRVWFIGIGDKAHAWNVYLDNIWEAGRLAFFIDGYARPNRDAFALIAVALSVRTDALGATGVPSSGRTASALRQQLIRDGGLHGNLHAIVPKAMAMLRASGFHLPRGIYRTDSLIGAVLMFACDPAGHLWDSRRVLVHPHASWTIDAPPQRLAQQLVTVWKRIQRQAQGRVENRAVRQHLAIDRRPLGDFPPTVAELIGRWGEAHAGQACRLYMRYPLSYLAARKLAAPRDWSQATRRPELRATGDGARQSTP